MDDASRVRGDGWSRTFEFSQSAGPDGGSRVIIDNSRFGTRISPSENDPVVERKEHRQMLSWAITFLIIAIIAAILGFGGVAGTAVGIAKILFFVFLVLFVVSLLMGRRSPPV
jgi:uncharacterized membrane protein YtjA (UPF0391 family)